MSQCDHCKDEAVGVFYLDKGCAVFPTKYTQHLCLHHENKATPIGSMELIRDFRIAPTSGTEKRAISNGGG